MTTILPDKKEQAAQYIAEGRLLNKEISEKMGVTPKTLFNWQKEKGFKTRVAEIRVEYSNSATRLGIARRDYRITCLARVHSKLLGVIEQRAESFAGSEVPGGDTGLMVKTYKVSGETVMTEYAVDTGLIRELRGIQEQVAKELGQIVEKREVKFSPKDMTDEQLEQLAADLA